MIGVLLVAALAADPVEAWQGLGPYVDHAVYVLAPPTPPPSSRPPASLASSHVRVVMPHWDRSVASCDVPTDQPCDPAVLAADIDESGALTWVVDADTPLWRVQAYVEAHRSLGRSMTVALAAEAVTIPPMSDTIWARAAARDVSERRPQHRRKFAGRLDVDCDVPTTPPFDTRLSELATCADGGARWLDRLSLTLQMASFLAPVTLDPDGVPIRAKADATWGSVVDKAVASGSVNLVLGARKDQARFDDDWLDAFEASCNWRHPVQATLLTLDGVDPVSKEPPWLHATADAVSRGKTRLSCDDREWGRLPSWLAGQPVIQLAIEPDADAACALDLLGAIAAETGTMTLQVLAHPVASPDVPEVTGPLAGPWEPVTVPQWPFPRWQVLPGPMSHEPQIRERAGRAATPCAGARQALHEHDIARYDVHLRELLSVHLGRPAIGGFTVSASAGGVAPEGVETGEALVRWLHANRHVSFR
jgi:hypothetical protein